MQNSKKYNMDIIMNDLVVKIFCKLVKSEKLLNIISDNKLVKRKINSILFYAKHKKINLKINTDFEHNKYIFMLFSFILSKIVEKQNNIFEKDSPLYSKINDYIFLYIIKLYKSKLVPFHYVIFFFYLYLFLIDNNSNNSINILDKMTKIAYILPFLKKLLKILSEIDKNIEDEKTKKLINEDIKNILRKLFTLNDKASPKNNFKLNLSIIKQKKLLELLKIVYDYYQNNIISDENKNYLKTQLINVFSFNFDSNYFNYLYNNIFKKFLKDFNNKNKNKKSYNNNISLMSGINDFLLKIHLNESIKTQKDEFYFNKYFIFDSQDKNSGIKTTPIIFNSINTDITIIFSFYANGASYNNKPQVLFTFRESEKDEYIFKLSLIGKKLYLITFNKKKENKLILMENVPYFSYNICILHYVQSRKFIYFFLNKLSKAEKFSMNIGKNSNIYIEVGYTQSNNNEIFDGIIGPIMIFNSNIDLNEHHQLFQNILVNLKGEYYLICEIIDGQNIKLNTNEENINGINSLFLDQIYYDEIDGSKKYLINKCRKELGNLLLYFNPEVILNSIGYEKKNKFRDYQYYNNNEKNQIYYIFNTPNLINDFPRKEKNIVYYFMYNYGSNLILFNIEYIYNYLLIVDNNYDSVDFTIM